MPILDRREPTDWRHVARFPLSAVMPETVLSVERMLSHDFPKAWRVFYDQGREGACVGFGESQVMSFYNRVRYDARWLWNEAKRIDEWADTNPGDDNGTSLRAGFDVLREIGHCRVAHGVALPPELDQGILANRWCTSIDEMRTAIATGNPVVAGTNWYQGFDQGRLITKRHRGRDEWTVDEHANLGNVRGGHCYTFFDASDDRQAFRTLNSWGIDQPPCWFPYSVVERLLGENGESCVVTDR